MSRLAAFQCLKFRVRDRIVGGHPTISLPVSFCFYIYIYIKAAEWGKLAHHFLADLNINAIQLLRNIRLLTPFLESIMLTSVESLLRRFPGFYGQIFLWLDPSVSYKCQRFALISPLKILVMGCCEGFTYHVNRSLRRSLQMLFLLPFSHHILHIH